MTNPTPHGQVPEALEDFEVRKLAAVGAVRTSSGLVERRPIEYRCELEDQFVRGFRAAEKRLSALSAAPTITPETGNSVSAKGAAITSESGTPPVEQQAEESHVKLLAECRDAFPIPEPGGPLEVHWAAAMACPGEVPEYVRMCVASMQAAPKAAQEEMDKEASNARLDIDSNSTEPEQQRDVACSLEVGQHVGNGEHQEASCRGSKDSELLKIAARNLKYFIAHAQFSSFADKQAALNCIDILAAPQQEVPTTPDDPLDWPLPCDIKAGGVTISKGCPLSTVQTRLEVQAEANALLMRRLAREQAAPQAPQQEAQEPVELPDVEDMAHSAVQEALSCGVNHDVFHRWMRAVMNKTVAALSAPQPAPAPLSDPRITAIEQALRDYHYALDCRQHGGIAEVQAFGAICNAMQMHWVQGQESTRRAALAAQGGK